MTYIYQCNKTTNEGEKIKGESPAMKEQKGQGLV